MRRKGTVEQLAEQRARGLAFLEQGLKTKEGRRELRCLPCLPVLAQVASAPDALACRQDRQAQVAG